MGPRNRNSWGDRLDDIDSQVWSDMGMDFDESALAEADQLDKERLLREFRQQDETEELEARRKLRRKRREKRD